MTASAPAAQSWGMWQLDSRDQVPAPRPTCRATVPLRGYPPRSLALLLLVGGCFGGHGGGGGGGVLADGGAMAPPPLVSCPQPIPPAGQGLSQPCCPTHGVDACGAGLFCAAFDGRTVPTCYAERSRRDGAACTTHQQCISASCNPVTGACRAIPGGACDAAIGCAPGPGGRTMACAGASGICEPTSPEAGGLCDMNEHCHGHRCVDGRCSDGVVGDPCTDVSACTVAYCAVGRCSDGSAGSPCGSGADCRDQCVRGTCSDGSEGSRCDDERQCGPDAPHCAFGECSDGWYDAPCEGPQDCHPDYPFCTGRRCDDGTDLGDPCTNSAQCAQLRSDLGRSVRVLCDPTKRTCVIARDNKCDSAWDSTYCESGTSCQPHEPGSSCSGYPGTCQGSYCSGPGSAYYGCSDGWACLAS